MERYCSAAIAGVRHREKSVRDSVVNAMRAGRLEWKSPEALGSFSKWSRSVFSVPRMASLCRLKVALSAFLCGLHRFISTRNPGGWLFVDKLRRSNAVRVGVSLRKLLRGGWRCRVSIPSARVCVGRQRGTWADSISFICAASKPIVARDETSFIYFQVDFL